MGDDRVLDFHLKCSEIQNDILSQENPEFKRAYIKKYIESLNETDGIQVPEFENGSEWFNVEHPLSFAEHLNGKILVLDFFTYCCINCLHILADLEALESLHRDTDGLVIVGVHSGKFDNEKLSANILSAVLRYNILHPVINDSKAKLWHALGIRCWPTLVIVNPYGRAIFLLTGEGHRETLKLFVSEAINYYEKKHKVSHDPVPLKFAKDSILESVLQFPGKICCSADGKMFAIADTGHHRIIITDQNGIVQACIGGKEPGFKDGCYRYAQFKSPQGVCFRNNQELYVADTENHAIRKIDLERYTVTTVAGTGYQGTDMEGGQIGTAQAISSPWDVAVDKYKPDVLFIAMAGTHQIWMLFLADCHWLKNSHYKKGTCLRFAGSGREENRNNNYPQNAGFAQPSGIAIGKTTPELDTSTLFVADSESSTIRAVSLKDGSVKGIVGGDIDPLNLFAFGDVDGKATNAKLQHPLGVGIVPKQGVLFVADSYNHKVKMVNPVTRSCVTIIGSGHPGNSPGVDGNVLNEPGGLAVHPSGDVVYIADTNNHCIKQLSLSTNQLSELPIIFPREDNMDVADFGEPHQRVCPMTSKKVELDKIKVVQGQRLSLQLDVILPDGCTFNKEAPHKWALFTEDVLLNEAISKNISGDIESPAGTTLCTMTVPEYKESCSTEIQVECSLFLCAGTSTCVIKTLIFVQPLDIVISGEKSLEEIVIKLSSNLRIENN